MFLSEEAFVGNADIDGRLVVILASEHSVGIFGLNGNLRQRIIVDTGSNTLLGGILV